jgi:probable rRNA maturation factor
VIARILPDMNTHPTNADPGTRATAAGGDAIRASGDQIARIELVDATLETDAAEREWLLGHLGSALAHLGLKGEMRVRIAGDREISAAHEEFLETPGTTDVLTFDMSDEDGLDVDILICLDEAQRRAAELGHPRRQELLLYCVHGLLHCMGYDDHEPAEYERMHAKEDEVLAAIGAGATFAAGREPGAGDAS